jgi:hypothetical protein
MLIVTGQSRATCLKVSANISQASSPLLPFTGYCTR